MIQILFDTLTYASTLFLMAAGLTLIFGVTRIVNFAHGGFFMLGAMLAAHVLTIWFPVLGESAGGYLLGMLVGALAAGVLGAAVEWCLLRRMYGAPDLYQLVATFGLTLVMHDAMRFAFGPEEVFAPRFPGLRGSVQVGDAFVPTYSLVLIFLGPVVWLLLHGLLTRSRYGVALRAATADREMLSALGVNPKPLMLGAVVLGCSLAGLAGALQLPREPAHLQMDVAIVVETFVVVVTGGLGSVTGAFWAALLIAAVHALGVTYFPQATLVLVFATMAAVLIVRPQGLMGAAVAMTVRERSPVFELGPRGIAGNVMHLGLAVLWLALGAAALVSGEYWRNVLADACILLLLGLSLQWMMALGGLVSFGHAAFFGLGAYGAALSYQWHQWGLFPALLAGVVASTLMAAAFAVVVVRSSGVYAAMLSLALAQGLWAAATQWVAITGGDNGVIGLSWVEVGARNLFDLGLLLACGLCIAALAWGARSTEGLALQASRDSPLRAAASGIPVLSLRLRAYVLSASLAGLAGALMAAHKGAVFPTAASVATSVDALIVILLGGVHQLWGALAGAGLLAWLGAELGRGFEYWKGALGLIVMLLMVLAPSGLLGLDPKRRAA